MSRPDSITKFIGLVVQPNSFNAKPGSMERAENVVIKYENLIDKRRGYKDYHKFLTVDKVNNIFSFDAANFAVGSSTLFKFVDTPVTAQAFCHLGDAIITVNKRNHGLTNGTFISEFNLPDSDPVTPLFPSRQSAFYGTLQISSSFTPTGTRTAGVITVLSPKHGLSSLDVITVTNGGTLSVATGPKTVSVIGPNQFTITDAGINGAGNFIYTNPHAFFMSAAQVATGTAASGLTAATYRYYVVQPGVAFTTTVVGKTRFVGTDYSGYFTTDQGLFKLEDADNAYYRAGVCEALDVDCTLSRNALGRPSGPAQGNRQISYRICYARKDANNILVLGAPGSQTLVANAPTVATSATVDAGTHVVTVTSAGHNLATNDKIYLTNVTATGGTIIDETIFYVTYISPTQFSFDLDDQKLAAITAISALSFSTDLSVRIVASIPSELTTSHIVQIFRTNVSPTLDTTPDPRYFKVYEAQLATIDISRGYLSFLDEQPAVFLGGTEELYTNYSREGETQAAARPPIAKDIALFKGHLFYFNFSTVQTLELNLVNTDLISNGDTITIDGLVYKYVWNTGNEFLGNAITTAAVTVLTGVATVTAPNAFSVGDIIYVMSVTVVGITEGLYTVASAGGSSFTFATGAGNATGTVTFEGREDNASKKLVKLTKSSPTVTQQEAIDATARALIRAVNRNTASTVYAVYTSLVDDRAGVVRFYNKNVEDDDFVLTASAGGQAYVPVLPTSGTAVKSENVVAEGECMFSKRGEPEAVPYSNRTPIGSKNFEGLRLAALRDSLIFIKTDGVFRLNGDSSSNFSVTILDDTTLCKSRESVSVLNNSVYMFANKGVVAVTDNAVQILSRSIEPLLTSITGYSYIENVTSGVAYESERLYLLSTVKPITALSTTLEPSDIVYAYNYLTNSWSEWLFPFSRGFNSVSEDRLYLISNNGENIFQERKAQSRLDYGDSQYAVPLRRAIISEAITKSGSKEIEVTSLEKHGFIGGELITISYASSGLAGVFAGGASDVNGLRFVTGVVSEYTFTFNAATNASGLVVSSLYFNVGMCECTVSAALTAGSRTVILTTSQPHGRLPGDNIYIETIDAGISALLTNDYYFLGTRTVNLTPTPTEMVISIGVAPTGSLTAPVTATDNTQNFEYCTALVKSGLQPQIGDMLYSSPLIYRIIGANLFDSTHYVLRVGNPVRNLSNTLSYLYSAYTATLKFTPITGGELGASKKWTEFHASFRNSDACSGCAILFGSDAIQASSQIDWDARVGTDGNTIGFNRWGHSPWGEFAWNQGVTTARQYGTAPCVHLRTYVPREVSLGTFIQPSIIHNVAGEPFSLQSITMVTSAGSQRSTR